MAQNTKNKRKAKRSNKKNIPKIADIVTPFENQKSRLSLQKSVLDIYDDKGTLYHIPSDPFDATKWTFQFDDVEEKLENQYGNRVNSGGDPNGESEILSSAGTSFPGSISAVIPDAGSAANAHRAHNAHEQFKKDFENSMRLNNYQSTGMINDTKRKEIIDLIATNRNDQVDQFLGTSTNSDFKENSKLKYEGRYANNIAHRNKKKVSDYRTGSALKEDSYNKLYPISEDKTDSDNQPTELTWKDWDFIPFILHDLVNKKYLPFRSFINSISDQSDAEWQDIRYLGRADTVQVYTGFARTLSVDFTTVAFTLEELHPMWQRLNYLVGLTKPSGYTTSAMDEANIPTNMFVIPPFVKFNLGDMYKDQPCVLTSVALTIPQEASWELTADKRSKNKYDFLNKTVVKDKKLVGQYPDMASVSISFKLLEKRLPKTNNRHFGHHQSEDDLATPDTGRDFDKGFNYNLIYPNPDRPIKSNQEFDTPNEVDGDPSTQSKGSDPFEGNGSGVCSTFPPSHYYISSGNRTRKDSSRIEQEEEDWKQCACEETAKLMGLGDADNVPDELDDTGTRSHSLMDSIAKSNKDTTGSSHRCKWGDDGCIESVNGVEVPLALKCKYTLSGNQPPTEEEEENPKPPMCPEKCDRFNEKDSRGRLIGYEDETKFKEDSSHRKDLKNRNVVMWIKDVSDYLAKEMNLPQIGSENYFYNEKKQKELPKLSEIKKVFSNNGSVVIEFDGGNPITYCGNPVNENLRKDFKIDCDEDDYNEIREIAGNTQPKIMIDTKSDFKIVINKEKGHIIDKSTYTNVSAIRTWLAAWVSTQMADILPKNYNPETSFTWKDSYINLNGKWNKGNYADYDLYYAPYEENAEKMVSAYKVFPGTEKYVYYEVNDDIASDVGINTSITSGTQAGRDNNYASFAELKIGFYALVSKKEETLSEQPPDTWFEDNLADELYERFFAQQDSTKENIKAKESGNAETKENYVGDGTQFSNWESTRNFLNPNNTASKEEELQFLQEKLRAEERVNGQLLDENIICMDYSLVGKWNETQAADIMSKMKNLEYQPVISQKRKLGQSRINLENYIILLNGTTDADINTANNQYRIVANKGKLIQEDKELERYTQIDFLKKEIEYLEKEIKEIENDNSDTTDDVLPHGVFFGNKNSDSHYKAWMRDHKYDKIDWKDGSNALPADPRPGRKPKAIPAPVPTTETPTPNTNPIWKWDPVETAIQYEVEFPPGIKSIVSEPYFRPTDEFKSLKKLPFGKHTIKVKAGRKSHGSGVMEWSTAGTHTVDIQKNARPPKPPRCPYKVMDVGEKDEYDRLIGPKNVDEPRSVTIERNIKTWMGDVMAYIMYVEDIGIMEYPTNPNNLSWSTNKTIAISKVGRNQMEWQYNGASITQLGYEITIDPPEAKEIKETGHPLKLNGQSLTKYANEFDCGCGPNLMDSESGSNTTKPPTEDLNAPKPSSAEKTTNLKPKWTWTAIRGANMYESRLRKVKQSASSGTYSWVTDTDYGVIQLSEGESVSSVIALDAGTYEISVTALYQENGQILKKSKAGTHIIDVLGGGTPTPTQTPTPTDPDYIKLTKDAVAGSKIIYVNNRDCMEVGSLITINTKEKQEEAVVDGFELRGTITANATGLGSWSFSYPTEKNPIKETVKNKSDEISELLADIMKLRSDRNCDDSDLSEIKDCFFGKDCKYPSFQSGIQRYNNKQLSDLADSLKTAMSATIGRGSSELPTKWFFASAKSDTKPFGVSADLISYDATIFGQVVPDILDTALYTYLDNEAENQTASGPGMVVLKSPLKAEHKTNTKVVCGAAQPVPTPTPVIQPTPTPSPIRSLVTPKPSTQSPTNEFEVEWNWPSIENANEYEIAIRKMRESNGRLIIVWEKQSGTTTENKYKEVFTEAGFYEIAVVAKNNVLKIDSEEGTHRVLIDESITPTPTITSTVPPTPTASPTITPTENECDSFVYGSNLYLEQESGYCPNNDESALNSWWSRSIEYAVCRWWAAQPKEVRERKGKYRIYEMKAFNIKYYINDFSITEEEFHNPQNITASSKIKRSQNYNIQIYFTNGKFPRQGTEEIAWSELYPYWSEKGFTRFDPSKGEQCPFGDSGELSAPKPSSNETTNEKTIVWEWDEVENANEYDVYLQKFRTMSNGNKVTINDFGKVATIGGIMASRYEKTVEDDGYYEIKVIAKNEDEESKPGTHVVYVNSALTPTPTPTPMESVKNPFAKPVQNLDEEDGVCEPTNGDAVKSDWYISVAKYVASDDHLAKNPTWSIRKASSIAENVDKGLLDAPTKLQKWPFAIDLKYFNRQDKSEKTERINATDILNFAKERGFGLSDNDKTLQELCEQNEETPTPTPEEDSPKHGNSFVYLEDHDDGYNAYCPDQGISALSSWWSNALDRVVKEYMETVVNKKRWDAGLEVSYYYRIMPWNFGEYSILMSEEDWHNPQNISSTLFPKYATGFHYGNPIGQGMHYHIPMDIKVKRKFISTHGVNEYDGVHYLAWSDLYPIWQRLGYSRVNPKKGEKCPR